MIDATWQARAGAGLRNLTCVVGVGFFLMMGGLMMQMDGSKTFAQTLPAHDSGDPFLWLEEVTGGRAMEWVRGQNGVTAKALEGTAEFKELEGKFLPILNSKERIPEVSKEGKYYYNFWRDEQHVRGVWRRTTLEEYRKAEPAWEIVLDVDALAAAEKENWMWKGEEVLEPTYDRCLVQLSRGGADAVAVREFDLVRKEFVAGGFSLPEAKTEVAWKDRDHLYVGTDFGAGSMTTSGYPRVVKLWKRGTGLAEAGTVFEGKVEDVSVSPAVLHDHGRVYEMIQRGVTFFTDEMRVLRGTEWVKIEKPADADLMTFGEYLLLRLKSDWTVKGKTFKAGTLVAENFDAYMKGERELEELFVPTERTSLESTSFTKNYIVLNVLENVTGHPYLVRRVEGRWERTALDVPALASVSVTGVDANESDEYWMTAEGFLTPPSLYLGTAGTEKRELLKRLPGFFETGDLEVRQFEAVSKDGTRVPYFQVGRKGMKMDGTNPTLLYGYGGFEIPLTPAYNPIAGTAWLAKGGVYVVANIRGGGEFGPAWHDAARKSHRQNAYDDFIAVAEDLIGRKVTSPKHLGIQGGSNGGLLMGVMLTERPELFGAVVCQAPLLDMKRYNKLLAGASWMDEYGDPDDAGDWAYLSKFSPYQNVREGVKYPPVLFMTSTRDDRVHPGHAEDGGVDGG